MFPLVFSDLDMMRTLFISSQYINLLSLTSLLLLGSYPYFIPLVLLCSRQKNDLNPFENMKAYFRITEYFKIELAAPCLPGLDKTLIKLFAKFSSACFDKNPN
jgi:hypothetical protein